MRFWLLFFRSCCGKEMCLCFHSADPNAAALAQICNHHRMETFSRCVTTPFSSSEMLRCPFSQRPKRSIHNTSVGVNTNHSWERRGWEGWGDGSRGERRRQKERRRRGGSWWCFGVSLERRATSSSTATSSLRLLHFPAIICHLQFPLTFAPSVTPLFAVPSPPHSSQLKKTKRAEARGESKSRLSHGETERNSDGEQSERRFSFFLSFLCQKCTRCRMSDVGKAQRRVTEWCTKCFFFKW